MGRPLARVVCVLLLGALSSPALAQQASGIAGVVTDSAGAVVPGVTVEAASPALIERVRSVVTGNDGRYNIVDLRPGTYAVTFALPGFSTVRRAEIVLTAGFTATINAQMQVGAIEETVVVTGASPLVDVQNTQQQKILQAELLQTLPTGSKGIAMLSNVVPGLKNPAGIVGGASGLYASNSVNEVSYHGKQGSRLTYDGMQVNNFVGPGGQSTSFVVNFATVEETAIETGGVSAESESNNFRINLVPKEGSNRYKFDATFLYANKHLQSNNVGDELRARGITAPNRINLISEVNVTLGGPIMQNRLWFFVATRLANVDNQMNGIYFNKTRGEPLYTPDLDRPAFRESSIGSQASRVTWQAAAKHKVSVFTDIQSFQVYGTGGNVAPEAQIRGSFWPGALTQATWSSPQTSRLLLEGGFSAARQPFVWTRENGTDNLGFTVDPNHVSTLELSTGFIYNAFLTYHGPDGRQDRRYAERFSLSYVTGAHAFKVGTQVQQGSMRQETVANRDVNYFFFNQNPLLIQQYATPYEVRNEISELGVYAQDRWSIHRLALTMGVRLDYLNGSVPAQQVAATPSGWIPERNFAAVKNVPQWTDLSPRLGVSYDLFGTGKTALKASVGRYVGRMGTNVTEANNPMVTSVNSVTRVWIDANRDFIPDCNLGNFTANGECLAISNTNFGKNNPLANRFDPELIQGFGTRDYFWDFVGEVQQQLGSRWSLTAGYNRTWSNHPSDMLGRPPIVAGWGAAVIDNLAVVPQDFSPYCITAPVDSRLPGGGGYQVCELYDVAPAKFGQVDNFVTRPDNFGDRTRRSDFVSLGLSSRFGSSLFITGSLDTGRVVDDRCFVIDSPQALLYCHVVSPFKANTLVKANVSYTFPGQFVVSGILQNLPGLSYNATYNATNAEIAPSLGRNLAACGAQAVCNATAEVPLVAPFTLFEPRRTQLDLKFSKRFLLGRGMALQPDVAILNALNASDVLYANNTYGPSWRVPQNLVTGESGFLDGRIVQVGGRFTW